MPVTKKIDCRKCQHYYVTWDQRLPHGCHAMNFKSKRLPSVAVQSSVKHHCLLYKPKQKKSPGGLVL